MKPGLKPNKTLAILGERYFDPADFLNEIWKDIPHDLGYTESGPYQVSNMGRVRNSTGSILGGSIDSCGYHLVVLFNASKSKYKSKLYFVHQLVLLTFVGSPPHGLTHPTVQHINHNKLDNKLENLMWMSSEDNNRDGHATKVHVLSTDEYFDSRELASLSIGRYNGYISECMQRGNVVRDIEGNVLHFEYLPLGASEWIEYVPKNPIRSDYHKRCYIIDSIGKHEFPSICHADRYLGHYEGYIQYRYKRNKHIFNSNNEEVEFNLI